MRGRRRGADEEVLLRPAETETSFEHFLWLIRGYANPERASFYLQKHALRKWEAHGLRADASPPPHETLAPFLRLQHELVEAYDAVARNWKHARRCVASNNVGWLADEDGELQQYVAKKGAEKADWHGCVMAVGMALLFVLGGILTFGFG